jgi:hypothetical protein
LSSAAARIAAAPVYQQTTLNRTVASDTDVISPAHQPAGSEEPSPGEQPEPDAPPTRLYSGPSESGRG